jgi:hypothetical protein
MSKELAIYKKYRIAELQNIFNINVMRLYNTLVTNVKNVQKSFQTLRIKQNNINNLINQYNTNVNILTTELNKIIQKIQNFIPKQISTNKNKKALLIGINYTGTPDELKGCINDANAIKERISNKGFNNITLMTELTNKKATRSNILEEFKNLLANSQEGDLLFFLYSGHGTYLIDKNNDETTGYDQCIVPCDLNIITDDALKTLIQTYLKPNVTLFAMFDSCFSGSVLDLKYQYMDSLNYDNYSENNKELETNGNVFMISGCTDYQTSADANINNKANGAMTWSFLEALKQKPNCSWRELVKKMRDLLKTSQMTQIPQFSSGTFENIDAQVFI